MVINNVINNSGSTKHFLYSKSIKINYDNNYLEILFVTYVK